MSGLLAHAARCPERPAFVLGNGAFVETYSELESRSRALAHALRELGLAEGDGVAMLVENAPACFDLFWATQRLGLILTPVNWHLAAAEVAYIVRDCGAKALVAGVGAGALAVAAATMLEGAVDHCLSLDGAIPGFRPLEPLAASVRDLPLPRQRAGTVMIYSSGTTGRPKGIRKPLPGCAFDDPQWNEAQPRFIRLFGFQEGDRYLCPAPLYHAAPLRSCAALHVLGGTAFAMPRFDAEAALAIVQDQRIDVSQWVPTHFRRLLELPDETRARYRRPALRVAVHAAAPCPPSDKRAMIAWWGPILLEYYAGTEGGGTLIRAEEWLAHPGSVGRPWANVELAILDEAGEALPAGAEGAVYFRDRAVPPFAYHGDEAKTRAAHRGEWFTLGDVGQVDVGGYLHLTDRRSDLIISGGVNVYPLETENCLLEHPAVADVAVIGVPDRALGESVRAVVRLKPGFEAGAARGRELIDFARARIAHFKAPRGVDFVDALPRTETGKLQRRVLRERYRSDAVPDL